MTPRADAPRRRLAKALWALPLVLSQVLLPGCGKKGPPLAPLMRVPARAEQFEARRLGAVVYLRVRIPDRNQDGSSPADLARLDIYGYTGDAPSIADIFKYGTLVASLPVRRPPEPEPPPAPGRSGAAATAPPKKAAAPARAEAGFDQGAVVVVTETLTSLLLKPVVLPDARRSAVPPKPLAAPPMPGSWSARTPGRTYAAAGYSRSGRRGTPSGRVVVPLVQAPQPPAALALAYAADHVTLTWKPPETLRRPVQEPASAGVLRAEPLVESLPASTYDVYEVDAAPAAPAPAAAASAPSAPRMPAPINEAPLAMPAFNDPRVAFGVGRCYVVRTVDRFGPDQSVASEPSPVACVTPKDTFPPAAPKGLQAVAGSGAISLIWEPNVEPDLAGYLVLRAVAPGGTLERLTAEPIRETTYTDATVKSGVRYVYAVVAVDTAAPFNTSPASNRVEVVAR